MEDINQDAYVIYPLITVASQFCVSSLGFSKIFSILDELTT